MAGDASSGQFGFPAAVHARAFHDRGGRHVCGTLDIGQIHIYQLAATLQSSPRYEDVRDGAPAGVPNEGGGR